MATGSSIGGLAGTIGGNLLLPGIGGALGGVAGSLLGGLFDPDAEEVPNYQQYSDPRIAAIIQRLMRSKTGEQTAANQAGRNTRNVNRQMEQLDNDPRFSGNPITRSAIQNQMTLDAEGANVNARLAGAAQDENSMMQAAQLQQGQNQFSYNRNMFERGNYQLRQEPTGLDTLSGQALSYSLGSYLGDPSGLGGSGGDEQVPGAQQQSLDYNALFNAPNDPNAKILKNRPQQPNAFQYQPPAFQPYELGPLPSSILNNGYGRNPLRY